MQLPFVSRSRYTLLEHNAEQFRKHAHVQEAANVWLRRNYDDLLSKYHALRSNGANPVEPLKPAEEPATPSDRAIEHTVRKFGNSPRLRRLLLRFQTEARSKSMEEDEIADSIFNWRDPDNDD